MAEFAQQGRLVDLSAVLDMGTFQQQYAQTWVDLGTVEGKLHGLFMKAAVKGLIWYNPKIWQSQNFQQPATWDELMDLSQQMAGAGDTAPWCVAVESAAASGWAGTDWIEDIVLRQAGPDVYRQWYSGQVKWTSDEIRQAWETWGEVVGNPDMVFGGANRMLTTNFGNVGDPLFTSPPGCYMAIRPASSPTSLSRTPRLSNRWKTSRSSRSRRLRPAPPTAWSLRATCWRRSMTRRRCARC
jgi:alpha-glucoside transport system substrate-binding protein